MDHICKVLQTGRLGRQGQQHRGRDRPEWSGRWSLHFKEIAEVSREDVTK